MGAEVVDQQPLAVPVQQQVVGVLTVDVDEMFTELPQQVCSDRAIVDEGTRSSAGPDDSPHDALVDPVVELPVGEPRSDGRVRARFEHSADLGTLGPGTNQVGMGTCAEKQPSTHRRRSTFLPRSRR